MIIYTAVEVVTGLTTPPSSQQPLPTKIEQNIKSAWVLFLMFAYKREILLKSDIVFRFVWLCFVILRTKTWFLREQRIRKRGYTFAKQSVGLLLLSFPGSIYLSQNQFSPFRGCVWQFISLENIICQMRFRLFLIHSLPELWMSHNPSPSFLPVCSTDP